MSKIKKNTSNKLTNIKHLSSIIYLVIILMFLGLSISASAEPDLQDVKDMITKGKFEAAVSLCDILISSAGDSVSDVLLEKGIALYYLWDKENALKVENRIYPIEMAISAFRESAAQGANETSAVAFKWIGDCYFFAMRYEQAALQYSEFEVLHPDSKYLVSVKYRKGKAYEKLNDYERAIGIYEEIISDYPDFQYIKTVRFDCMRLISIVEKR
ncbi:tetratricopeptide repeat protein [bacterium]|nr:tetratricopeptide repeat protein [bacterium]